MPIVFAWRATDGFTARYSGGGATGETASATSVQTAADAGAIGGVAVTCAANNLIKYVSWQGRGNVPANATISVLARIAPGYGGTPAVSRALFSMGSGTGRGPGFEVVHAVTTGTFNFYARNETNGVCMGAAGTAASGSWSATSAAYTDYFFTYTGTTGASAALAYANANLVGGIANATLPVTTWNNRINEILLGTGFLNGVINADKLSELVIWDAVIDVNAVPLDDNTTAALSGATRTAFVTVAAFDGVAFSTLAAANVKSPTVYTAAGVPYTGSYVAVNTTVSVGGTGGMGWPQFD